MASEMTCVKYKVATSINFVTLGEEGAGWSLETTKKFIGQFVCERSIQF